MVTITERSDGTYMITADDGPCCIVVPLAWLNGLVRSMRDQSMIETAGWRPVKPPA